MKWIYLTFVSDQVNKTQSFSDDSSETLWLAIAFISSTESCVSGYNAALSKRVSLARRQPKREHLNSAADAVPHCHTFCDCIKYKTYYSPIFCLLEAAFKIYLVQKSKLFWGMTSLVTWVIKLSKLIYNPESFLCNIYPALFKPAFF